LPVQSFLDIGCGSGLSMLALGAARVYGIDVDAEAVSAAETLLTKFAPNRGWQVEQRSLFDFFDDTFDTAGASCPLPVGCGTRSIMSLPLCVRVERLWSLCIDALPCVGFGNRRSVSTAKQPHELNAL
jgi:SAM-dependent methyltransferase